MALLTLADLGSQNQFFESLLEVTQNSEIAVQLGDNPLMFSPPHSEQLVQSENKITWVAVVPIVALALLLVLVIMYLLAKRKKKA